MIGGNELSAEPLLRVYLKSLLYFSKFEKHKHSGELNTIAKKTPNISFGILLLVAAIFGDEVSVRTFSWNVSAVNHSRPWWRSLCIHSICKLPLLWFTARLERMRGNFHIPWHNWFTEGGWGEDAFCSLVWEHLDIWTVLYFIQKDYLGLFCNAVWMYILLKAAKCP